MKTKFIVQPFGETMQVPAETAVAETPSVPAYGGAVPRQLGSSRGSSSAELDLDALRPGGDDLRLERRREPGGLRLRQDDGVAVRGLGGGRCRGPAGHHSCGRCQSSRDPQFLHCNSPL